MPVSPWPCIVPVLLLLIPLLAARRGRTPFILASAASLGFLALVLLWNFVPGLLLMPSAHRGDPIAQYELARWTENHGQRIGAVILWPFETDVFGGFQWLERAAAQDYAPAVYAVGVRLKYGWHTRPPGPGGNHFPEAERGQRYIDRAIELGYQPPVPEERWYAWWREIPSSWD